MKKDKVEEDFARLMGIEDIRTDTCSCCRKVYNNVEYDLYGHDKHSMCKQCQVDNAIADMCIKQDTR